MRTNEGENTMQEGRDERYQRKQRNKSQNTGPRDVARVAFHQTVRDGKANEGSRPILDFGGKEAAEIMESAEFVRVGPHESVDSSEFIPVETIVASSASSSSDCGVRHVVDEAGDGELSFWGPTSWGVEGWT